MSKVRKYAKSVGFKVVGKLKRHRDRQADCSSDIKRLKYIYYDEAENEFWIDGRGRITIITADGGVV